MVIVQEAIYRNNVIHITIPTHFFKEIETIILNFICKHKRTEISQTFLNNKSNNNNKILEESVLGFNSHNKPIAIKIAC